MRPRKHTVETMSDELFNARKAGSASEVRDLLIMIGGLEQNLSTPDTRAASNRQAQRRFQRSNVRPDVNRANLNRKPVLGDRVEDPSGDQWVVTEVAPGECKGIASNGLPVRCFNTMLKITVPVGHCPVIAPAPVAAEAPGPCPKCAGSDALYHAIWDVLDAHTVPLEAREALEGALATYEITTPA